MTMTPSPKEKAVELVESYFREVFNGHNKIQDSYEWDKAKKCAIIAVDEMIKLNGELYLTDNKSQQLIDYYKNKNAYLFEVKEEIEKL